MSTTLSERLERVAERESASGDSQARRDGAPPTVTAFPDGSVDRFYDVFAGGDRVRRRESFAEAVAEGRTASFALRESAVEPGGHAVNAAVQADALGGDVTLVGHLDDPAFADLRFETVSTGAPSDVAVYEFDDGDVLAVEPSDDVENWSLDAVRAATGPAFEELLSADAVLCANWATFEALPAALAELAAAAPDGGVFVFDPGEIASPSESEARELFDALTDLTGSYDVIFAANGAEVETLAGMVGEGGREGGGDDRSGVDVADRLARLRERADLTAAVLHETDAAVAATPDGRVRVENFDVDPARNTGGGDRFDAGLAHALALGWGWEGALRLGNACASRYVATGETGSAVELARFLRERG